MTIEFKAEIRFDVVSDTEDGSRHAAIDEHEEKRNWYNAGCVDESDVAGRKEAAASNAKRFITTIRMSETREYPLSWPVGWPRTQRPMRSKFGNRSFNSGQTTPSVDSATTFLMEEVQRLNGQRISDRSVNNFLLSTNIKLRNDGLPYSNQAGVKDAGVALYFKYKGEAMVIACDTFDRVGCNIYAIALTIEAMRGIERWGASELLKRAFTGFKALPETASASSWYQVLQLPVNASADQIKDKYRELVKKYHPDNQETGDAEKFIQVQKAYEDAEKGVRV